MLRILVLAVLLWPMLQSPAAAQAKAGDGGAYMLLGATAGKTNNPRAWPTYKADFGLELGAQLGLGYAYRGWRVEAQVGYEAFLLDNLAPAAGAGLSGVDGYGKTTGPVAMASLFFRPGEAGTFQPFVGAGIGLARLNTEFKGDFCSAAQATCYTNARIAGGSDTVEAWQWAIGMSKLSWDESREVVVGYRYFSTRDYQVELVDSGPVTQDGLESHSLMLSMRWYFGKTRR